MKDYELFICLASLSEAIKKKFSASDLQGLAQTDYFVDTGALYSLAHVLASHSVKTHLKLDSTVHFLSWSHLQVESMLLCLQLLSLAKPSDLTDYGIVQHVVRVIDTCSHALSLMWESGYRGSNSSQPQHGQDVGKLAAVADCDAVADLLCACYELLGLLSTDDLGRREILKFDSTKVLQQLYNTAAFALPALSQMGLQQSTNNLKELTGWFLQNLSIGMRSTIVKEVCNLKLYPFYILQVLLLSPELKLF